MRGVPSTQRPRAGFSPVIRRIVPFALALAITSLATQARAYTVTYLEIGLQDSTTHAGIDGNYIQVAPINPQFGVGWIMNPLTRDGLAFFPGFAGDYDIYDFSLHDHANPNPDPARDYGIYGFDSPVIVDKLIVVQHSAGVTAIEGFVGESASGMFTSIGTATVSGDQPGGFFVDGTTSVFDFPGAQPGTFFEFIVRETPYWSTPAFPEARLLFVAQRTWRQRGCAHFGVEATAECGERPARPIGQPSPGAQHCTPHHGRRSRWPIREREGQALIAKLFAGAAGGAGCRCPPTSSAIRPTPVR